MPYCIDRTPLQLLLILSVVVVGRRAARLVRRGRVQVYVATLVVVAVIHRSEVSHALLMVRG